MDSNSFGIIAIVAISIYGILIAIYLWKESKEIYNV